MTPVRIEQLFAFQFRNLQSLNITPSPLVNVLYGKNGQGKTNILEAISFGSSLRGIRSVKNKDLILFGQEQSRLKTKLGGKEQYTVDIHIFQNRKQVRFCEKPIKNSSLLNQKTAVVSFVPDDLSIVTGSALFRRNLLDQTASGLFPTYNALYKRFEKALMQKNRLLKTAYLEKKELDSFNQVFAQNAAPIVELREHALRILLPAFQHHLKTIAGNTLQSDFDYKNDILKTTSTIETIQRLLEDKIASVSAEENLRKAALIGPHLDDINIALNNNPARYTASRGQARAIVLALKLAQIHSVAKKRNVAPILLLDDVIGELDPKNSRRLLETIHGFKAQTFITTTHLETLPLFLRNFEAFHIESGQIKTLQAAEQQMHFL